MFNPNDMDFRHSGRGYWIVRCHIPIHVAEKIYESPESNHIRVAGHCDCVPPEEPWTTFRMPDGTELLTMDSKKQLDKVSNVGDQEIHKAYMKKFTFSDDPVVRSKATCYVELYHIDTKSGLRVFLDYLRIYNIL